MMSRYLYEKAYSVVNYVGTLVRIVQCVTTNAWAGFILDTAMRNISSPSISMDITDIYTDLYCSGGETWDISIY